MWKRLELPSLAKRLSFVWSPSLDILVESFAARRVPFKALCIMGGSPLTPRFGAAFSGVFLNEIDDLSGNVDAAGRFNAFQAR